jgi:hypothetical protein
MTIPTPKDVPHKWPAICSLSSSLSSNAKIVDLVLSKPFLDRWVTFRDAIPLSPGMNLNFPLNQKEWITEFATKIFDLMDSPAYCSFDNPSPSDRALWKTNEHFQCLIYQSARRLARPVRAFFSTFDRKNFRADYEKAEANAIKTLKGLVMVAHNLVFTYIYLEPTIVVQRIEALRPTPDPAKSPIPKVRVEHALRNVDVAKLSETILQPQGDDQKKWFTELIAGNPELMRRILGGPGAEARARARVKREREGEEDAGRKAKRKKEEDEKAIIVG